MIHEGNNAVLLIATTYEEDTGTFTCRATTSAGTVETSAKLIVKSKNWIKDTNSIANTRRDWIDGISLYGVTEKRFRACDDFSCKKQQKNI